MALGEGESEFFKGMAPGWPTMPVDGPTPIIIWTIHIGLGGLLKCVCGGGAVSTQSCEGVES